MGKSGSTDFTMLNENLFVDFYSNEEEVSFGIFFGRYPVACSEERSACYKTDSTKTWRKILEIFHKLPAKCVFKRHFVDEKKEKNSDQIRMKIKRQERKRRTKCNGNKNGKKRWWIKWTIAASIETTTEPRWTEPYKRARIKTTKEIENTFWRERRSEYFLFVIFSHSYFFSWAYVCVFNT